jgi:hypothetical protein
MALASPPRGNRAGTQTTTCTYHCGSCGLHFHSLNAFDAHREGDYASSDPKTGRHCVHPLDLDGKLAALTEHGECRIGGNGTNAGITVWTHAGDLARMRHLVASRALHGAQKA